MSYNPNIPPLNLPPGAQTGGQFPFSFPQMQMPGQQPLDPGQFRLNASTIDPMTGQRVWKQGAGPTTGLPGTGFQRINPLGGAPSPMGFGQPPMSGGGGQPQTPGMFMSPGGGGGGGGSRPDRNPRGSGADPFDPSSKFAGGKYYAEGGPIDGPGTSTSDSIPIMASDGEWMHKEKVRRWFGDKHMLKMDKEAEEGLSELEMKMPEPKSQMPMMMPDDMPRMAMGGPVNAQQFPMITDRMNERGQTLVEMPPSPYGTGSSTGAAAQVQGQQDQMWAQARAAEKTSLEAMPYAPAPVSPAPSLPVSASSRMNVPGQLNDGHFLAPWEKDAQARALRPQAPMFDGMNRTQSRRFAQSPQGAALLLNQKQHAADVAHNDKRADDAAAVALNRDLYRTNTGIQLDAMNRAANKADKQDDRLWQTERTKEERAYDEKRRASQTAEQRAAAANWKPLSVAGRETGYAANELGNLINMGTGEPAELNPEQIAAIRKDGGTVTVGPRGTSVRYEAEKPEAPAKPQPVQIVDKYGEIKTLLPGSVPPKGWTKIETLAPAAAGGGAAAPVSNLDRINGLLKKAGVR